VGLNLWDGELGCIMGGKEWDVGRGWWLQIEESGLEWCGMLGWVCEWMGSDNAVQYPGKGYLWSGHRSRRLNQVKSNLFLRIEEGNFPEK
jgi:hypothetical protein